MLAAPADAWVFVVEGEKDVDNEHGNWWLANLEMDAALKFAKYAHRYLAEVQYPESDQYRRLQANSTSRANDSESAVSACIAGSSWPSVMIGSGSAVFLRSPSGNR